MVKTVTERVGEYRERLKQQGMVHLTLVVPAADANFFRDLSAIARSSKSRSHPKSKATGTGPRRSRLTPEQVKIAERWALRSGMRLRLSNTGMSLGELLARNIAHEIATTGWPVGSNFGSEAELLQRYRTSKSVLQEAVRLLEFHSIAVMERGSAGGLKVAEPTLDSATFGCGAYLVAHHSELGDLFETRIALESSMLDRCFARMNERTREELRRQIVSESSLDGTASTTDLQRFHMLLAKLSGDPAMELFLDVILRMTRFQSKFHKISKTERAATVQVVRKAHAAIIRALLSGNLDRAQRAMKKHLTAIANWLADPEPAVSG